MNNQNGRCTVAGSKVGVAGEGGSTVCCHAKTTMTPTNCCCGLYIYAVWLVACTHTMPCTERHLSREKNGNTGWAVLYVVGYITYILVYILF